MSAAAIAQESVYLVDDLETLLLENEGSNPAFVASDGTHSWFVARRGDGRTDLYRSDGSTAGTVLVAASIAPEGSPISIPSFVSDRGIVLPSGRAVFPVPALVDGGEVHGPPFGSDGTQAGTEALAPDPEVGFRVFSGMTEFAGDAWFVAQVGAAEFSSGSFQLWRTDGTAAGTKLVPGTDVLTTSIGRPVAGGGLVYFDTAAPSPFGAQTGLYTVDAFGSPPVQQFFVDTETSLSPVAYLPAVDRALVLVRRPFEPTLSEWWAIGPSGADKLIDAPVAEGPSVFSEAWSVESSGTVYLNGVDPSTGTDRLFTTDGTVAGTVAIADAAQGLGDAVVPSGGAALAGGVVHLGWSPAGGLDLVFSDLSGTSVLADLPPSTTVDDFGSFVAAGGSVFVQELLNGGFGGTESIWVTDGSVQGTVEVPGFPSSVSTLLTPSGVTANGLLLPLSGGEGFEPWRVNANETVLIDDLLEAFNGSSGPRPMARLGRVALFNASTVGTGSELWSSDGTAGSASIVADQAPGPASFLTGLGGPESISQAVLGERLLFTAQTSDAAKELGVFDGATESIEIVELNGAGSGSSPRIFVRSGAWVYFVADTLDSSGTSVEHLFRSDGSAAGTVAIAPLEMSAGTVVIFDAQGIGGADVFFSGGGPDGRELWRSDGTTAGTYQVADIRPGPPSSAPLGGVAIDGQFFFHAFDDDHGREVWVTDGTEAGTRLVVDANPGPASSAGGNAALAFDGSYVTLDAPDALASGPIAIDVLTGEVRHLVDPAVSALEPGLGGAAVGLERVGDALTFSTVDGTADRLWRATEVSTPATLLEPLIDREVLLLDPFPMREIGGGYGLFAGVDELGSEPWVLDPGGATYRLADLAFGPISSTPRGTLRVGSRVVFSAENPETGRELYATTIAAIGANVAEPVEGGCAGGGSQVATLAPVGSPTLGADFDLLLEGAVGFAPIVWAFDTTFDPVAVTGPCQALLPNPAVLATGTTGPGGGALLDLAIPPDPALLDLELTFQAVIVEAVGPFLGIASLSDGLEVVVGP